MSTTEPGTHHAAPFRSFERATERVLGVDMRLLYGFAVPILMVCGVIVLLALAPSPWMVAAVMLLEAVCLGVVVTGFVGLLGEDDEEDADRG